MLEKIDRKKLRELIGDAKSLPEINEFFVNLKKQMIEMMYDEELKEHLGFERSENSSGGRENYRNGSYKKKVKTSNGELELEVPRDRIGEFEPQVVKKYQTDILGIEDKIIALYGCGMSTRDISANIQEIYGFEVSAEVVSNVTNKVLADVKEWQSRQLKDTYSVVFMDGMVFKVKKDNIVQKCTAYICIGVDMEGIKEVLGIYIGCIESSKYWLSVMNDFKTRGLQNILIFCTDNLNGLDSAISACFPSSDHQKCIVHQIRNSVKHVSYKDLRELCSDLKTIYKAPNAEVGASNLEVFCEKWDKKYDYIGKSWRKNWAELSTFWKYPTEIRTLIYTTNPIESFNRNIRKYTKNKSSFVNEDSLIKSLFLSAKNIEKKWTAKVKNWGIIYSQLLILFDELNAKN